MSKIGDQLDKLCKGVRAIGNGFEIRIKSSEIAQDQWSVMICADAAIIVFTDFLPLDEALDQALRKLASISSRMMAAVKQSSPPGPPASEPPESPKKG